MSTLESPPALLWRRGFAKLIAYPWLSETRLHAHPRSNRLPFAVGHWLSIYEACRILSGRHPYPSGLGVNPCMALISGGLARADCYRHFARRGLDAFLAIKSGITSGEIQAELHYTTAPTEHSDGVVDWLNTKIRTADIVQLCKDKGWRVRSELPRPVEPTKPTDPIKPIQPFSDITPSGKGPRRLTPSERAKAIDFLAVCPENNCDKAIKIAKESLGLPISQTEGRELWELAGRKKGPGKRQRNS